MTRDEALKLLDEKIANLNLKKHMLATEAVMRRLARRFGEDEDVWGLAGLLHDLDYDLTVNDFAKHGLITEFWLLPTDFPRESIAAIKGHAGNFPRETRMAKALFAVDPVTGFIVAAALMHPTKKLASLDLDFLERRFKEKRFAAGANREQIETCSQIDMTLSEFLTESLAAMQEIHEELGL
jgi:predicted hydrolase (HD superfamily)